MKEEIIKMFHRIELDKTNDSCGFEFADGFSCTFDNIATCYDDRLKLYDLVKDLQSQLKAKEEAEKEFIKYLEEEIEHNTPRARWKHYNEDGFNDYDIENGDYLEAQPVNITLKEVILKFNEILSKGENK